MKKSIFMIIAILTTGCAACFAGCVKNSDNNKTVLKDVERRIITTDDGAADDGNSDNDGTNANPDEELPDNGDRKPPHVRPGNRRKRPVADNFIFIVEIGPHFRRDICPPEPEKPVLPETDGEENAVNN